MRVLHLTLKKEWFQQIATGNKTEEYREPKPYWQARLEDREYDVIYIRNGYSKNAPRMCVEWLGCEKRPPLPDGFGVDYGSLYAIKLGKIKSIT